MNIVIVGGGAGGLELAVGLAKTHTNLNINLIDKESTHIWKPHLHEVAAGTLDSHNEQVDYLNLAARFGFQFTWGAMTGLDRTHKRIYLDKKLNSTHDVILPERTINYDVLIIATGSTSNDFGTPGVQTHAYSLDDLDTANSFYQHLLEKIFQKEYTQAPYSPFKLSIVGGGATGVELAAELTETTRRLSQFGLSQLNQHPIEITVINAASQLLPGLSDKISTGATHILNESGVKILNHAVVTQVSEGHCNITSNSTSIRLEHDMLVWAAGVKSHALLSQLNLEVNSHHQLIVNAQLQTSDPSIFAMGDCAQTVWIKPPREGMMVPPRAQAAHQMSNYLIKHLLSIHHGKPAPAFQYKDFGSLVSLGTGDTVGTLMGFLQGRNLFIEGKFAKMMYLNLYHHHQVQINGLIPALALLLSKLIQKRFKPKVKLH